MSSRPAPSAAAPTDEPARQRAVVQALLRPEAFPHPAPDIRLLETHISYVVLTGDWAYKIKKPLDLGFLDFTTLAKRRFYCIEELRLNRRLAPRVYADLVAITGAPEAPRAGGPGAALDYAVKMRQFPQEALFSALLAKGGLDGDHMEAVARRLAAFHTECPTEDPHGPLGTPARVWEPIEQNFRQMAELAPDPEDAARLAELEAWSRHQHGRLEHFLAARHQEGFIRECHGDLHLANLALVDGAVTAFDCIEFNENLRWIDVMNEVAFMVMDLWQRRQGPLARRFLNEYLEATGDYAGLRLLPYYLIYRAMVRAKIALIRARAPGRDAALVAADHAEFDDHLLLAERFSRPGRPFLALTHGLSGSGKSRFSRNLLETLDLIRLRSDVERKRIFGIDPLTPSRQVSTAEIYGPAATDRTYRRLVRLAGGLLRAGHAVVVDAASLERWERDLFRGLAREAGVPFRLLDFSVPAELLRERLTERAARHRDPSEADHAVLDRQIARAHRLDPDEAADAIPVGIGDPADLARVAAALAALG